MAIQLPYSNTITRNYSNFYNLTQEIFLAVLIWECKRFRHTAEVEDIPTNICRALECNSPQLMRDIARAWRACKKGKAVQVRLTPQLSYYMSPTAPENAAELMNSLQRNAKDRAPRSLYEILQHERQLWIRINLPTPVMHSCTMDNLYRNAGILMGVCGCKFFSEAMQDYCAREMRGRNKNYREPFWDERVAKEYGMNHELEIENMLTRRKFTARMPHPRVYQHALQHGGKRKLTKLETQVLEQLDALYGNYTAHDSGTLSDFTCNYIMESPEKEKDISLLLP